MINYDLPSAQHGGIQEYIHRIGRTARIGHQGLATSFYNDRNEDIAQDLVNTLIECDCRVPDFLQHLVPEDGKVIFDDDSQPDTNGENGDAANGSGGAEGDGGAPADSAWGAGTNGNGSPADNAWGATTNGSGDGEGNGVPVDNAWGAPAGNGTTNGFHTEANGFTVARW